MEAHHETEIEGLCSSTSSEEDTWWKLFRLLIPGMDTMDESMMKLSYYPCKHTGLPHFLLDIYLPLGKNLVGCRH